MEYMSQAVTMPTVKNWREVQGHMTIVSDDWDLAVRARDGDAEAFARLVKRYQTPIISFCRRMVGSVQDAEDLAQECFVRLYRHLDRLKPQAAFSTLLFAIARNLTLNAIRDQARRGQGKTHSLTRNDATVTALPDAAHSPDRVARLREIESLIERGLDQLPPKLREVIVLREFNGLDYETIAKVTGRRVGTVKSRLARAREQLRDAVIELGGDVL